MKQYWLSAAPRNTKQRKKMSNCKMNCKVYSYGCNNVCNISQSRGSPQTAQTQDWSESQRQCRHFQTIAHASLCCDGLNTRRLAKQTDCTWMTMKQKIGASSKQTTAEEWEAILHERFKYAGCKVGSECGWMQLLHCKPTYCPHSIPAFLFLSLRHRIKSTDWATGVKVEFFSFFCLSLWPSASLAIPSVSWG